ncbi:MAG: isoprenylcysteine carboxylmethyltransferase family protein [Candidatus Melainabacteria bacterium]|nr:isoprenylcysteine carboxylmethyltransferase family protein [Candidatus Melainabacteria bacterium]
MTDPMSQSSNTGSTPPLHFWIRLTVSTLAILLSLLVLLAQGYRFYQMLQTHTPLLELLKLLLVLCFYLLLVTFFIIRKPTQDSSLKADHWFFALSGTLLPFALKPVYEAPWSVPLSLAGVDYVGVGFQMVGLLLTVVSLGTLGRGFGIIAARRDIKTQGLYRLVRHPLYMAEGLCILGMTLNFLSLGTLLLFVLQTLCQVQRIREEEQLLARDADYASYLHQVRYRLFPGVY